MNLTSRFNLADRLFDYEADQLTQRQTLELFCDLANSNWLNKLQGHYGRTFRDLKQQQLIAYNLSSQQFEPTHDQPADPCEPDEQPTIEQLAEWEHMGGCEALDGCWVEPDGTCPHGCPSWLLHLGLI